MSETLTADVLSPATDRDTAIEARDREIAELKAETEAKERELRDYVGQIAELTERLETAEQVMNQRTDEGRQARQQLAVFQAAHNDAVRERKTRAQVEEILLATIDQLKAGLPQRSN